MITKYKYDTYLDRDVYLYVLKNEYIEVGISDFGALIRYINYDNKNVTLGHKSTAEYVSYNLYFGALVGRVANRTKNGEFSLNGKDYKLNLNDGGINSLHGGNVGFDKKFYQANIVDDTLELTLLSPDMEENYPGNLSLKVIYKLDKSSLICQMNAISDCDTLFAPTLHTYFNLGGEECGDVGDTMLKINSTRYTPSKDLIPTGEVLDIKNTVFDFIDYKAINKDINDVSLVSSRGYDHNFILNDNYAASAYSPKTNIALDLCTDLPCIQLYTGGFIDHAKGISREYNKLDGFCLEPQYVPNAINSDVFEKPIIKANEPINHYIKYTFSKR